MSTGFRNSIKSEIDLFIKKRCKNVIFCLNNKPKTYYFLRSTFIMNLEDMLVIRTNSKLNQPIQGQAIRLCNFSPGSSYYTKSIQSTTKSVAFSEGRKRVNTLDHLSTTLTYQVIQDSRSAQMLKYDQNCSEYNQSITKNIDQKKLRFLRFFGSSVISYVIAKVKKISAMNITNFTIFEIERGLRETDKAQDFRNSIKRTELAARRPGARLQAIPVGLFLSDQYRLRIILSVLLIG